MKLPPPSPTPAPTSPTSAVRETAPTPVGAADPASPLPPRRSPKTVAFARQLATTHHFDTDAAPRERTASVNAGTPTAAGMEALWKSPHFKYSESPTIELVQAIAAAPDAAVAAMTEGVVATLHTSERSRLLAAASAAGAAGLLLAGKRSTATDRTRLIDAIRHDAFRPAADDTLGMNEWRYFRKRFHTEALGALNRAGLDAPEVRALLTDPTGDGAEPSSSTGKPEF